MRLSYHELLIYVDEDYRENVLRNLAGRESVRELLDDLQLNQGGIK